MTVKQFKMKSRKILQLIRPRRVAPWAVASAMMMASMPLYARSDDYSKKEQEMKQEVQPTQAPSQAPAPQPVIEEKTVIIEQPVKVEHSKTAVDSGTSATLAPCAETVTSWDFSTFWPALSVTVTRSSIAALPCSSGVPGRVLGRVSEKS